MATERQIAANRANGLNIHPQILRLRSGQVSQITQISSNDRQEDGEQSSEGSVQNTELDYRLRGNDGEGEACRTENAARAVDSPEREKMKNEPNLVEEAGGGANLAKACTSLRKVRAWPTRVGGSFDSTALDRG